MGKELDKWIHENLFGLKCGKQFWVVNKDGSDDTTVPFQAQNKTHAEKWLQQGNGAFCINRKIEIRPDCPNYSGDIAEAWKVVEKMRDKRFYVEISGSVISWSATFEPFDSDPVGAKATTLPEAICLAAKLALENK